MDVREFSPPHNCYRLGKILHGKGSLQVWGNSIYLLQLAGHDLFITLSMYNNYNKYEVQK